MASRKPAPRSIPANHAPSSPPLRAVTEVAVADIDASDETFRQRAVMDIADLVAELRVTPQQVPVFLRARADGRYQIVAGFRRVSALKELGRRHAKAIVVTCDDAEAWCLAWAENVGHRKLRGIDLSYFVFRLHDEGHNADEIARLCSMSARDADRVASVGRLPDSVRALVRAHGLTLRHAAVIAAFLARHPRTSVEATVAAAAKRGLGEAHLAEELDALVAKKRGRPVVGVSFRDRHRLAIDMARAQPEHWSEAVQARMRALAAWLEEALVQAATRPPRRPRGRTPK